MAIIIQNIDENIRGQGVHKYQLRITRDVICEFTHLREEGLAQCLRKAAKAYDKKTSAMDALIGRTVERLLVSADQWTLAFDTDQGIIAYQTDADCCSETWFADILGVENLIGATISEVEDVDMVWYPVKDGRSRQDIDEAYGWKLITSKGRTDIAVRNSSNGYYGGRIGLYTGNLPEGMKEITSDWQT